MKKCFAIICAAIAMVMTASAQNPKLNPLNYSGKMYVSAVEVLTTPRYVSYEEHAILSSQMTVPVMEVTVAQFDFEKKVVVIDGKETRIGKTYVKEYSSDYFSAGTGSSGIARMAGICQRYKHSWNLYRLHAYCINKLLRQDFFLGTSYCDFL